ncbi:hypothetical protein ACFYNZ_26125 [Streptomyces kebangsaanensis]|uniref:Uncharacterized protein n=1 Tax=Streptomyces kebangsaanensis TaxID=864058 RepID=A0ABW6L1X2_9ACTN
MEVFKSVLGRQGEVQGVAAALEASGCKNRAHVLAFLMRLQQTRLQATVMKATWSSVRRQAAVRERRLQRRPTPRVRPAGQVVASVDQVESHEVRRPLPRCLGSSRPASGEPLL